MTKKIAKAGQWGFVILTFALLLYRITLHADVNDEIMNLSISYRIILGDIPFYHVQEVYQIGAIFMVPFVWLFVKLTGGTTGIVLYSRVLYILVLVGCAVLMYRLLRNYMRKDLAFFLSYVIVFFELFSLYYLWYDSMAVIFCLLGNLAIVKAVDLCKGGTKRYLFLMLAGMLHFCMAAVHVGLIPMALGTALFLFMLVCLHYRRNWKRAVKCVGAYAFFPIVILLLALLIILVTGNLENVIVYLQNMLGSRGSQMQSISDILREVIDSYMVTNSYLINLTKGLLVVYVLTLIFPKLYPVLMFGIIIFPIYNQYRLPETSVRGLPNYLSYLALWAPLLFLLLRKKEKLDWCLWYIFWLPFPLSAVFTPLFSLTSVYGPIKAWQMCLPAGLAALYYMIRLWKEKVGENSIVICKLLTAVVCLTLLWTGYRFVFLNQPLIEKDDVRLTEGIYAGIKVNESMECMPEMQKMVQKYVDGAETILASSEIRCIYLMSDLRPFTRTTEMATNSDGTMRRWWRQLDYFWKIGNIPDLMFLEWYDLEDEGIYGILDVYYEPACVEYIGEHTIYVYKRAEQ